jgi:hypothetical protein
VKDFLRILIAFGFVISLFGSPVLAQILKPAQTPAPPAKTTSTPVATTSAVATKAMPGKPLPTAPTPSASAIIPAPDSPVDTILSEDLIRALRDPFQIPSVLLSRKELPKTDLETYQLKDFHLNGVITGPKKIRAMLTAPGNKVYFVRIGDRIGVRDGTITQILPDASKVVEYFTDEHGKRIPDPYELMMSGELVSLNKKEE